MPWRPRIDRPKTVEAYNKAIELEPRNESRLNSLAWMLATHPEPKIRAPGKAVELATKAVQFSPKEGERLEYPGGRSLPGRELQCGPDGTC